MHTSAIKYQLLHQFYGIEEYLDMVMPLPSIIDTLDTAESEFNLLRMVKELDVWFIRVSGTEQAETWNPLKEPLFEFTARHPMVIAHLYPDRQITDQEIVSYTRQWRIAC